MKTIEDRILELISEFPMDLRDISTRLGEDDKSIGRAVQHIVEMGLASPDLLWRLALRKDKEQ